MVKSARNQQGVSLLEVLIAVAAIGIIVFLISSLPNTMNLVSKSRHASLAKEVAVKAVEDIRSTPYINLTNTVPQGEDIADIRVSLLPSGTAKRIIEICDPLICTQGENVKQIKIRVTWNESGKTQEIVLRTLVTLDGLNQ